MPAPPCSLFRRHPPARFSPSVIPLFPCRFNQSRDLLSRRSFLFHLVLSPCFPLPFSLLAPFLLPGVSFILPLASHFIAPHASLLFRHALRCLASPGARPSPLAIPSISHPVAFSLPLSSLWLEFAGPLFRFFVPPPLASDFHFSLRFCLASPGSSPSLRMLPYPVRLSLRCRLIFLLWWLLVRPFPLGVFTSPDCAFFVARVPIRHALVSPEGFANSAFFPLFYRFSCYSHIPFALSPFPGLLALFASLNLTLSSFVAIWLSSILFNLLSPSTLHPSRLFCARALRLLISCPFALALWHSCRLMRRPVAG